MRNLPKVDPQCKPAERLEKRTFGGPNYTSRSLAKGFLERGRFRTFLLTALQRFLISEWRREQTAKRAGPAFAIGEGEEAEARYQLEPVTDLTPERIYDKRWACLLIENVQGKLREESARAGKLTLFNGLSSILWEDRVTGTYADLSRELQMSEGALRIAAHRLRLRFRELLRAEIEATVADPAEIDEEMRYLFRVFA